MKKLILLVTVLLSFNSFAAKDVSHLDEYQTAYYNAYCSMAGAMAGENMNTIEYHSLNAKKVLKNTVILKAVTSIKLYIFESSKDMSRASVLLTSKEYYSSNCPNLLK